MLAERRDLIVATYSSVRGTGERSTVSTLTGSGCAAGGFASVFAHPVVNKSAPGSTRRNAMITDFVSLFMGLIRILLTTKMLPTIVRIQKLHGSRAQNLGRGLR